MDPGVTYFPIRLIKLSINRFRFTPQGLQDGQPHLLPHLMTLMLHDAYMDVPLQQYFTLPKLKELTLSKVNVHRDHRVTGEQSDNHFAKILTDRCFSQGFPKLEMLDLTVEAVNEDLLVQLQSSPRLQSLTLDCTLTRYFVSSFTKLLEGPDFLPSLRIFDIYRPSPWPETFSISYEEFIGECFIRRPYLDIYSRLR
jgi:hypothetical protein